MVSSPARFAVTLLMLALASAPAFTLQGAAWGNGDPLSAEFPNFGIHDITCDIALRTATLTSPGLLDWMNDWYVRNATDWGYSFDPASGGPTATDNINAYTDDPDSYWKDWDNHTLYLHPRSGWDPPDGDAARRVHQLYNETRDHIYDWLMNGSVRFDAHQHLAAYSGGLMAHYVMDVTQFGHTDWTQLDHDHPPDFDPDDATYHSYYEAQAWTDRALRAMHVDLMMFPLPSPERVDDPARTVTDLAAFVNGRHGPPVQFEDVDQTSVTLGSTYVLMLETFVSNWDAGVSYNGARGYDAQLWNLSRENLKAGMDNLTNLWTSAFLDARDRFLTDAADIEVQGIGITPGEGIFEGQEVAVGVEVSNLGHAPTGEFEVRAYMDEELEVGASKLELLPGEHGSVFFHHSPPAGYHRLSVVCDATQVVPESNESNNIWSVDLHVEAVHHESGLTADPVLLEMLQEDTGRFDLTLWNLGNRDDLFELAVDAYPGTIDFSLTMPVEMVYVPAFSNSTFRIDVATRLDNPVGPRAFVVTATGGNSTAEVGLTVLVKERQVAPFIEVDYGFFTNVSVPMTFDASRSWDHNGDEITFTWDWGDGTFGTGAVVEHAWAEEGVYVINLTASDGQLHRRRTLEVSVEDAIPPRPQLAVTDVDFNAAAFEWTPWVSTRYFETYRLYLADGPDADGIVRPENLLAEVDLFYVDNATLRVPPGGIRYAVLEVVNIYGDAYRSNVVEVVLELRTLAYAGDDPLHLSGMYATSDVLTSVDLVWREWLPLLPSNGNAYIPSLISTKVADGGKPSSGIVAVPPDGGGPNRFMFEGLEPAEYMVWVDYVSGGDSIRVGPVLVDLNATEWAIRLVRAPPTLRGMAGKELTYVVELVFSGATHGNASIDWGDGSAPTLVPYAFEDEAINLTLHHTYGREGNYTARVEDTRALRIVWTSGGWWYDADNTSGPGLGTSVTTLVEVLPAGDDGQASPLTDYAIAIGLIFLVAVLAVLAGHLTGYYRIGSEGRRRDGPGEEGPGEGGPVEEEARPTAEEIVTELETRVGGSEDGDYLDHEPTVAELEAMIPRPPRE